MGLLKAKKENAQVILIWMDMPETSILLKQWYDMKVPAIPYGTIIAAAEEPNFWKATEGKGEYCLASVVNAGNSPSKATPWTMKFVEAYQKKWNVEPEGYGTSSSYMAVYTLKDAIERAGTVNSDAVVAALEKTDLMGVYGRIKLIPRIIRSSRVWIRTKGRWEPSSSGRQEKGSWCSHQKLPWARSNFPPG